MNDKQIIWTIWLAGSLVGTIIACAAQLVESKRLSLGDAVGYALVSSMLWIGILMGFFIYLMDNCPWKIELKR